MAIHAPKCAIKNNIRAMTYLPTLTLSFPGGQTSAYRINEDQVEFQKGDGTWRVLSEDDVELHFALHTEVSKWLLKYQTEKNPHRLG